MVGTERHTERVAAQAALQKWALVRPNLGPIWAQYGSTLNGDIWEVGNWPQKVIHETNL